MGQEVYTLQGGEKGQQRLNILNNLYNPSTQQFLMRHGLHVGMRVLEVGCGTGEMACWIAQQVRAQGEVIAVDSDIKQINLAKQLAARLSLNNVTFLQKSIYELDATLGKFDMTFTRWVIGHLIHPKAGLNALFQCLKPGGKMINISPHLDSVFAYPESGAISGWYQLWTAILNQHGKDIRLGYKLPALIVEVGCRSLAIELFQPMLSTAQEKNEFALNLQEASEFALATKIVTPEVLQQLIVDLQEFSLGNHIVGSFRNIQVCGIKNITLLRNEVAYQLLIIIAAHFAKERHSYLTRINKKTLLAICDYIEFPHSKDVKSSARACAEFIYDNFPEIWARIKKHQSIKLIENSSEHYSKPSRFSFFYSHSVESTAQKAHQASLMPVPKPKQRAML